MPLPTQMARRLSIRATVIKTPVTKKSFSIEVLLMVLSDNNGSLEWSSCDGEKWKKDCLKRATV
jgi:hypothetical protein